MYRTITLIIVCFATLAFCWKPDWTRKVPQARRGANYYYRTASASALTEEDARAKAFNDAVEKSAHALGIFKEIKRDPVTGEVSMSQEEISSGFPIDQICEYREQLIERNGVRVYLLFRVAKNASVTLEPIPFDCERSRETER